ncbi:hypothetical protein GPA22_01990 [Aromatoleum toluvorans]|uniref:Nucleotidyl transferase AbiEii toxin, Type IV TA system n=1 Tax=Aromatoleum toluvorans TaxID=92002 RepID=A0ABX1PVI0_9RHOO|nr:nucleotidyl transferase AbiEii/AbiGii toxin family protein [Aromatoleum toluvorans]NMG42506.1 hypothetical protein [Aromatoleum toluvorans]
MSIYDDHVAMIACVAEAIGPDLCKEVAFVGGCTTGLLLTDPYTRELVRHTDDVDLIVHVISTRGWHELLDKLRSKGFKEDMQEDGPICAMYLNGLRVDFMPDDASILSFSNIWYRDALQKAEEYRLSEKLTIRLVRPEYFIATKLEAYRNRGNDDPLESRDIEDILNLLDGRPELPAEILAAPKAMRVYISEQFSALLRTRDFDYAVQAAANSDSGREELLVDRIKLVIGFRDLA